MALRKRGSGKTDYRNQTGYYGGVEVWFIKLYFTGAVRNEKTSWNGIGSFREWVGFSVLTERFLVRDLLSFLIA